MGLIQIPGLGIAHYHEYGSGKKPMLAFHGYGMTGKQFQVLEQSVLQEYHIYGFDHFFHGKSTLDNRTEQQIIAGMPKVMVAEYVEEWFKLNGRQRFSLMGYSIGANLALVILEYYAEWVDDIILMAPDGLSVYKGFHFLTHHPAGKIFFRLATKSKWLAPALLKNLKRARFIDDGLYQIAYNEMDTSKKRLDVYYTLNLIRLLKPDTTKIAGLINRYHINCRLIFGKSDHLFPVSAAAAFISLLKAPHVHEVALGHWLVVKELDEYLVNLQQ